MHWLDRFGSKKNSAVGVEILPTGVAVVVGGRRETTTYIDALDFIAQDRGDALQKQLEQLVKKHKIQKWPCHVVLSPDDYQLLLVEAPEVADSELRHAMKWRIKDLVNTPLDQIAVDVFRVPEDASRSAKKMVYVVVAELPKIKYVIDVIAASDLSLMSIDIGELTLRNLSLLLVGEHKEKPVGVVRVQEGSGVVSLYREGNLYLSRQFKLLYGAGLLDELPVEQFTLEIQRSLDYYERQMGLTLPAQIYICGENITEDKINTELKRSLNVSAAFLDMENIIEFDKDVDTGMTQLCVGASGAVFRQGGML